RRPSRFTISRLAKERLGLSASSRTVRLLRAGRPHTAWTVDHLDAAHARRAAARSGPRDAPEPGLRIAPKFRAHVCGRLMSPASLFAAAEQLVDHNSCSGRRGTSR